jgi:CRISPR system Cascade subunit CasA
LEGPTDIEQAKALFKGGVPVEKITAYLSKWNEKNRFWLIDNDDPFWQVPTFKPNAWRAWTALAAEHNADNAKVLFDHVTVSDSGSISFADAAKWLLATQTFAVSAGKSEISHTGKAPSPGYLMVIPIGSNLMDTLIFCLFPQNREVMQDDFAIWEKEPETLEHLKSKTKVPDKKSGKEKDRAVERSATGIVDLFTWRSRSIILDSSLPDGISNLGFASGVGFKESAEVDPMLAYELVEVTDEDTKERVKVRTAIQLEEKGIWRDFDSLLPDDTQLAPKVIEHAATLSKFDRKRRPQGVMVLGQKYFPPRPNIAYWRGEFFVLPEAIISDRNLRYEIRKILLDANKAGNVLYTACELFAKNILSHGERKVEKKDIRCFVEQMTVLPEYWSTLETCFHEILGQYTLESDSENIYCQWLKSVRNALRNSWLQHNATISSRDTWAIRAVVKAEKIIDDKLTAINKLIEQLKL